VDEISADELGERRIVEAIVGAVVTGRSASAVEEGEPA
jgi:hypothetical protein